MSELTSRISPNHIPPIWVYISNTIKSVLLTIALLFSGIASLVHAQASNENVNQAALAWLAVIDKGDYGQSWQLASPLFQGAITENKWSQALKSVRTPLGKVASRAITNSSAYSELPGMPDGEYQVIVLNTSFDKKANATETISLSKAAGEWKVIGYFIK